MRFEGGVAIQPKMDLTTTFVLLAAWYPEGKDDPRLTILRFDADDGRVWVNEGGFFKFAFEIAKANLTKTLPDSGGVADVNLQ